ncbi:hypothetical protein JT279_001722 [Listeria monocytogenes]|uniref:hypothetical protein n=1 Tax=Listeria welshimeri TaxID=1643 RepID=UPI001629E66A|nr:hypothetical protein [Listeria welshimeri]EAE6587866.1 hypothetical protein [Listeria monocytogenes]EHB7034375.1 hypothetical protein [Listeria monocytogenes]EHB7062932.1 hypothetical protein [Listeria monocytogenes]EHB7085346.1 hypothetical protein [Listeria monocytogenes]EHB7141075.1 hypothetical protein [Listeria monocytogenes]
MSNTYYVKREFIKDLDGAIFDKLRGKLKEMSEDGRAVIVKENIPSSNYKDYEKNINFVKYFC